MVTKYINIEEFAGGGGATTGRRMATGKSVDVAVNHSKAAIAMHAMNHPETLHFCQDVWKLDPLTVLEIVASLHGGAAAVRVAIASGWFSPDCKHFSKAKGGALLDKRIRGLCWILLKWCGRGGGGNFQRGPACPVLLYMENVEEFKGNGPLIAKRCPKTGRVVKRDGSVAAPGERVRYENQWLVPCPKRVGLYFKRFVRWLRAFGGIVDWCELRACNFGAATLRKRLYFVVRFDGMPVAWPEPTHGDPRSAEVKAGKLLPWVWTAKHINWALPCPSIFLTRRAACKLGVKRPLVLNTRKRLAKGIKRYVMDAQEPFFVTEHANSSTQRNFSGKEPMRTMCGQVKGGHFAVVAPFVAKHCTGSIGSDVRDPLPTVVAGGYIKRPGGGTPLGLCAAFLAQHNGGMVGHDMREPMSTVTAKGSNQAVVMAHIAKYYGTDQNPRLDEPLHTVTTKDRFALVETLGMIPPLTPELAAGARRVAIFLRRHGVEVDGEFAYVGETDIVICDVGTRMFSARELFDAQGFPSDYIIDRGLMERKGRMEVVKLTKNEQVMMVGNSVSPPVAAALIAANQPRLGTKEVAA